jgi:hypothetical protein
MDSVDNLLARIQVTAEPNGYAVWHNLEFHSFHRTDPEIRDAAYKQAMYEAQRVVKEYKSDYQVVID